MLPPQKIYYNKSTTTPLLPPQYYPHIRFTATALPPHCYHAATSTRALSPQQIYNNSTRTSLLPLQHYHHCRFTTITTALPHIPSTHLIYYNKSTTTSLIPQYYHYQSTTTSLLPLQYHPHHNCTNTTTALPHIPPATDTRLKWLLHLNPISHFSIIGLGRERDRDETTFETLPRAANFGVNKISKPQTVCSVVFRRKFLRGRPPPSGVNCKLVLAVKTVFTIITKKTQNRHFATHCTRHFDNAIWMQNYNLDLILHIIIQL